MPSLLALSVPVSSWLSSVDFVVWPVCISALTLFRILLGCLFVLLVTICLWVSLDGHHSKLGECTVSSWSIGIKSDYLSLFLVNTLPFHYPPLFFKMMLQGHNILTFLSDIKSLEILTPKIHGQIYEEIGTVMASSKLHTVGDYFKRYDHYMDLLVCIYIQPNGQPFLVEWPALYSY